MGVTAAMIAIVFSPEMQTASIGIPDTMFLMVLALIVFGPRRLPEIGRQIGKLMYEFRKVSNDFKFQMEEELRASEEASRQQKLEASRTVTMPAQPLVTPGIEAASTTPEMAELTAGSGLVEPALDSGGGIAAATEVGLEEPAAAGEVRGAPRKFPPTIQPPSGGEPVAAARPFRGRIEDANSSETVTDSGIAASALPEVDMWGRPMTPSVVSDEGRIGTEVQPGVAEAFRRQDLANNQMQDSAGAESEREARHV